MDKITVVTVTFNAAKEIAFTMKSVFEQDYSNIEYIIMDGKSTDDTVSIAENIREQYTNSFECVIISEKDNGIYDAMNKAIKIASGKWILFMNAGDAFYSPSVISSFFSRQYGIDVMGVYGDTERFKGEWKMVVNASSLDRIKKEYPLPFCHQSVFIRTDVLKETPFDLQYKQAADYNFFVQCYLKSYKFVYVNKVVSKYSMGGISETNTVFHLKEKIMIREKSGLEKYSVAKKARLVGLLYIKQVIKKVMPSIVLKKIRGY